MFAAFKIFLLLIPVLIIIIVLILVQGKKNRDKAKEIQAQQKSYRYCRNCGQTLSANSTICASCGARAGTGKRYCPRCGNKTDELAVICVNCGIPLEKTSLRDVSPKSKVAAGLFGILFGSLGVHNFYLGYTLKAVSQVIITVFCFIFGLFFGNFIVAIWGLIEGIMILAGGISKDANGRVLS